MSFRNACGVQIQRLDGTRGFPSGKAALKALIDALEETVTDAYQAGKVMDQFDEAERCPRPQTIRRTAWELFPPQRSGFGCPACKDPENLAPPGFLRVSLHGQGSLKMCRCHPARLSAQPRGARA